MKKFIAALAAFFTFGTVSFAQDRINDTFASHIDGFSDRTISMPKAPDQVFAADKATVTCNLIYDNTKYTPLRVYYNMGLGSNSVKTIHRQSVTQLSIAPGKYCIFALFTVYNPSNPDNDQYDFFTPSIIVMKEVDITSDCTLDFDMSTATNQVNFQAINPKGEPLKLPVYDPNAKPMWNYENSNILAVWRSSSIWHPDFGELYNVHGNDGAEMPDGRIGSHSYDYLINNISDQFMFMQSILSESSERELHLISMSTKGLPGNDKLIANDKNSFIMHEEEFVPSPLYPSLRHEMYNSGIQTYAYLNSIPVIGYKYVSEKLKPGLYVSNMETGNESLKLSFKSTISFYEEDYFITGSTSRNQMATIGCPLKMNDTGLLYENPFNSYFNCPVEDALGKMGDNVPVNALTMHSVNSAILYYPAFCGRWGEIREADIKTVKAEVRHNGNLVCDSYENLNTWAETWATNGHEKGIVTARFTTDNSLVDGITGTNTVETTYDENYYETCAPVLQFLTFRNSKGQMTDRFDSTADASLLFTASDYNGNGKSGQCMDVASWKAEVSPYHQDNFIEIPTQRVQDMMSTRIWSVYKGSLQNVDMASPNGWFDVRITLVDNVGNKSVQTISPAFKVTSLSSGMETINVATEARINAADGVVTVNGMENPVVTIYSLSGSKVLTSASTTIDVSGLAAGMYVVRAVTESDAVTAKIIIR